ncbi:MAG: hypothetical protein M3472_05915, partial [Chloroflexota bacterium]|nr:hypothetical protein [Chloroflexota bacterium]
MTQRRHPDDPPREGDELFPERSEPATSDPDQTGPASELPGDDLPTTAEPATVGGTGAGTSGRLTTPITGDELPYVDDRVSKLFIAAIVAVFAAIFAYALLFG